MNTRLIVLLAAVALPAAAGAQQENSPHATLRAFRSDRELLGFLSSAMESPALPPPAIPCTETPATPASQLPAGAGQGDSARDAVVITGRVTNTWGCPEPAVMVRIPSLSAGASTGADGTYRLVVPGWRVRSARTAQISASRPGLADASRSVALFPGAALTQDFQMPAQMILLEDVIVGHLHMGPPKSIHDNQQEGSEESGIVKLHGEHLVILRHGRLFTVNVAGGRLEPVSVINAFGPDVDGRQTWDQELHVSGDDVVVIGHGYTPARTEIGLFSIDPAGRLRYRETYQLRLNLGPLSDIYRSRLIGTRLVTYTRVDVPRGKELTEWIPAIRRWRPDVRADEFRRTLPSNRVYGPGQPLTLGDDPTLHTVTVCDLARPPLECESSAVLGPQAGQLYVSPHAVYVWTRGSFGMVYRLPLDGSAPSALRVEGTPVDPFSFMESGDGHLNVLVRSSAAEEGTRGAEHAAGDVRLLRVPLHRFGNGRARAREGDYRALPKPAGNRDAFHNRFVGRHLLYATGDGDESDDTLYVVGWADGSLARLPLSHGVDRIEAMGANAVVVDADSAGLHLTGIRLSGRARLAQRYVHRNPRQDDLRSDGFFYRSQGAGKGLLGLSFRNAYGHGLRDSASVVFLGEADTQVHRLGELSARWERDAGDTCIAQCVAWYGDSRPIFLGNRILALLGYEIVQGAVVDGRIREVQRAGFAPQAAMTTMP